ncbi:TPA: BppU family phage baseplate upper protein [Enterococcus faecium]|nr:BppU family phage baseplate upper protein [Enterococcus faecium]NTR02871.1 BppU family phage baseplate upper protein [Enterococcus faecium]
MAHIIKKGPIKVPTQPKDFDLQATGLVFKSYDNQIALEFNVVQQDGTPADLLGANLRLLMFIYDEVDGTIKKEPIPFITKNLITESFLNGHVVYILPEAMKAYNGMVEAYVYIEYPDGSTSDNLGFTFRVKRSAIDGLAQDKADYFIEDFKQLLAAASLEANKVIEGLDTEIKNLQQAAKDANAAVDGAMDRIDELEAEIGQLERLREMYIDTLDFEGYNYSVRPNLMRNIKLEDLSSEFTGYRKPTNVTMENGCFVIDVTKLTGNQGYYVLDVPRGLEGKRYTYSVEAKADVETRGVAIRPVYHNGTALAVLTPSTVGSLTTTMTRYKLTTNALTAQQVNSHVQAFQVYIVPSECTATKIYVKTNIKMEEGTEASGFQPNLLAKPYNMCREYPNENIADPTIKFPIKTSGYRVYGVNALKNFEVGKKYTITIEGTKPSTQQFVAHNSGDIPLGALVPVEGLPNVWTCTFTPTKVSASTPKLLSIYQMPSGTAGACQINWLKLEEGDTRTPIDVPTYKGLGILDSNDPTKYVWNYTELVDVDGIQDALENVEQRTATLEGKANTIDGRLNNVNTALNTVQSTADQILAEVTAADVMKETDLPGYLANKPIVAGGMADFAGKVHTKLHPNPHKCANYALAYEHASQAPNAAANFETTQSGYDKINKLDGSTLNSSTGTIGQTANLAFKFDLISQITKDFPSFFDDCPTQETKVAKIQKHIISATLTLNAKTTNTPLYVAVALNDGWSAEKAYAATSQITEQKYAVLNYNSTTRSYIQNDGSIIFRARTRTLDAAGTVQTQTDYVRFDYTLDLSSDDFITPIERDVTKDNLTQILSDDSAMIKGVMDFKGKVRGNNTNCPHATYLKSTSAQATNMSEITYEADADMYNKTQNKNDGLASVLRPEATTGYVGQAKYKFDLVTAIEKEHPHLFKGLTTTKQKVDVLKAKMQELKFNVWARGEGTNGNIQIGSSLSNVDAIDTRQTKEIGETTEFAQAEFYSSNNFACARRINDDGTILYWLRGSTVSDSLPQPKVIIDYVNLEYTLSDKTSDYVVAKTDATYLAAVAKTKELDRYKEYFSKGTSLGADTPNQTTIPFGSSMGLHGTRAVTLSGGKFTATKQCKLLFDFSIKMRGNDKTGYIYVKPYKNGVKADDEACAAVGGFRDSTGATATLKFQNNTPLKYIAELNTGDTLEFKVEIGSSDKIQEVKMLFGTIEEI